MQSYDSFVLQNLQLSSIVVQNVISVNLHFGGFDWIWYSEFISIVHI